MTTSPAQKLQIKSGKLIVLNAPKGYAEQLATELKDLTVATRAAGQAEAVLLFVNSLAEAEKLTPKAGELVKPGGMLWIAYAKGASKWLNPGPSGRRILCCAAAARVRGRQDVAAICLLCLARRGTQ